MRCVALRGRTPPAGNHMLAGAARGRGWLLVPDAASIDPKNEPDESSRCSLQDIFVRFHCLHCTFAGFNKEETASRKLRFSGSGKGNSCATSTRPIIPTLARSELIRAHQRHLV